MQSIVLSVTPSQIQTIRLRAKENGFDEIAAYLKVLALRTDSFVLSPINSSDEVPSVEISFSVDEIERAKIEKKVQDSSAKSLEEYLLYIALYGIVNTTVEIRSSGSLDSMLERIAQSKKNQR